MKVMIWNDRCYKLIEEGDKFDAKIYTIVRKLFIRWNAGGSNVIDEISSEFRSFGQIEGIEIVNDEPSTHSNSFGEHPVSHEAYVLYVKSEDAYGALKSHYFPMNLVFIVPADIWHQPDYKEPDDAAKIVIESHHQCDMSSITREFSNLSLNQNSNEMFCQHTVVKFEMKLKLSTTLDEIRRTLRQVMPVVGDLSLEFFADFDKYKKSDGEEHIGRGQFQRRVTEVIADNARGPKLKTLTINGLSALTNVMLKRLAPVLKPLTELNISTVCCNILYMLPALCPNLIELNLNGHEWDGPDDDVAVQAWPTLELLAIKGISLDVDNDTDTGKRFRYFVSLNPQLDTLEMDMIVDNSLLKAIGKSMRKLSSLNLSRESFDGVGGMIDQLGRLKHLESILVDTMHLTTNHFKSLVSCVECLSNKKRLRMATLIQNYIVDDEEPVPIDTGIPIKYHDNCSCHGDNRAITFNDESQSDVVNLPKHKPALAILVKVERHLKIADQTLHSRIHTMFKQTKKCYPNVLKTVVIEEPERFIYIHISSVGP